MLKKLKKTTPGRTGEFKVCTGINICQKTLWFDEGEVHHWSAEICFCSIYKIDTMFLRRWHDFSRSPVIAGSIQYVGNLKLMWDWVPRMVACLQNWILSSHIFTLLHWLVIAVRICCFLKLHPRNREAWTSGWLLEECLVRQEQKYPWWMIRFGFWNEPLQKHRNCLYWYHFLHQDFEEDLLYI